MRDGRASRFRAGDRQRHFIMEVRLRLVGFSQSPCGPRRRARQVAVQSPSSTRCSADNLGTVELPKVRQVVAMYRIPVRPGRPSRRARTASGLIR